LKDWKGVFIALTAAVMFGFGIHPIGAILIAGLCGLGFYYLQTFPAAAGSATFGRSALLRQGGQLAACHLLRRRQAAAGDHFSFLVGATLA
jgi:hypothetical protein